MDRICYTEATNIPFEDCPTRNQGLNNTQAKQIRLELDLTLNFYVSNTRVHI